MALKIINKQKLLFFLFIFSTLTIFAQGSNPFLEDQTVKINAASASSLTGYTPQPPQTVFIGKPWVNIRSGPNVSYDRIKTFPQGSSGVKVLESNGWTLVNFDNGTSGWVRSDLLSDTKPVSTVSQPEKNSPKQYLDSAFERWDRNLGSTFLNFSKLPFYWKLSRAGKALAQGNFEEAYELAQMDVSHPLQAQYIMAKALYGLGRYNEAKSILKNIEGKLEDKAFLQKIDQITKPYIDEPVVFKFGGFDTVADFQKKKDSGARLGLESEEYYDKFVDLNTWKWKSPQAYKDFQKIGGIDCSGYVQRVLQETYKDAGAKWPIPGRTSVRGFTDSNYTKEVNPGYRPPPPPDIKVGDIITLDYGHNRYGHSMIYRGTDSKGNIEVTYMGDTPVNTILDDYHLQFYQGTFRMNGLDKVRDSLTA
ncbi:MAG: SH3 domain-containing protein [Candidatus Riflebacteria bacterium]|nr:SH3 domain-containing protein [Candidatus Riflebacteria bacterium]